MTARALIETALEGVVITVCWRCNGWGHVGLPTLSATCPICHGSGRTTTNELEVSCGEDQAAGADSPGA